MPLAGHGSARHASARLVVRFVNKSHQAKQDAIWTLDPHAPRCYATTNCRWLDGAWTKHARPIAYSNSNERYWWLANRTAISPSIIGTSLHKYNFSSLVLYAFFLPPKIKHKCRTTVCFLDQRFHLLDSIAGSQ